MPPSENVLVSVVFGGGLVLAAVLFGRHASAVARGRGPETGSAPRLRSATRRQSRIVGLLLALGLLIPLGDLWLTWRRDPRWFAVYVLVILGLSLWLLGLGVGEVLSVRASASRRERSSTTGKHPQ